MVGFMPGSGGSSFIVEFLTSNFCLTFWARYHVLWRLVWNCLPSLDVHTTFELSGEACLISPWAAILAQFWLELLFPFYFWVGQWPFHCACSCALSLFPPVFMVTVWSKPVCIVKRFRGRSSQHAVSDSPEPSVDSRDPITSSASHAVSTDQTDEIKSEIAISDDFSDLHESHFEEDPDLAQFTNRWQGNIGYAPVYLPGIGCAVCRNSRDCECQRLTLVSNYTGLRTALWILVCQHLGMSPPCG